MKKLKKIKLSNIENSQLEKYQLVQLKGGYGNPCYDDCQHCVGAGAHVTLSVEKYREH